MAPNWDESWSVMKSAINV